MKRIILVICTSAMIAFLVPSVNAEMIGHWKFDEGTGTIAADSTVNGYDAEQVNTEGGWTTGRDGNAYNQPRFTLDVADSDALNLVGRNVSLSTWVTTHNTAQYGGIAGFEGTGTAGDIYSLKMDNADKINWTVLPSHGPLASSDTLANYAATRSDGWVHVVGVFEEGVGSTLYVNGSVAATGAAGSPIPDKTTPSLFRIGTYYNSSSYEFNGSVDDVRVYDEALSADDVVLLFGEEPPPPPPPVEPGLLGHWKFDDGSGTTAVDSSGSGYDAEQTIAAGSWITGKADGAFDRPRFSLDATE